MEDQFGRTIQLGDIVGFAVKFGGEVKTVFGEVVTLHDGAWNNPLAVRGPKKLPQLTILQPERGLFNKSALKLLQTGVPKDEDAHTQRTNLRSGDAVFVTGWTRGDFWKHFGIRRRL